MLVVSVAIWCVNVAYWVVEFLSRGNASRWVISGLIVLYKSAKLKVLFELRTRRKLPDDDAVVLVVAQS